MSEKTEEELVNELDELVTGDKEEPSQESTTEAVPSQPVPVEAKSQTTKPVVRGKFDLNKMADNIVKRKQQEVEDNFYNGFSKLIEKLANDEPVVLPSQKPIEAERTVPSAQNVDAIQLIDNEILNPNNKNLDSLYRIKQQLLGKPISTESTSTFTPPKKKQKGPSLQLAIALFCLSMVIGVLVWGVLNFR